jgi:RHS repeat-associated protein
MNSSSVRFFGTPEDGYHVAELFTGPVNYETEAGVWAPIETTLEPTNGGFQNGSGPFDVFFPTTLTPTSGVDFRSDGVGLSSFMLGASPSNADAGETSVTYRDVRPQTDVRFDVTTSGYSEKLTLHSSNAPDHFDYRVETDGVSLRLRDDDSIQVNGPDGREVAVLPAPFADDSSSSKHGHVDLDVSLTRSGNGSYKLSVRVPRSWLSSNDRVFPVTIDPDIVKSSENDPANHKGSPLIKDTWADPKNSSQTPQYASKNFQVGGGTSLTGGGPAGAYLTFDIRQQIRQIGQLIYSSDFKAYNFATDIAGSHQVDIKRIKQNWQQEDIKYQTTPVVDNTTIWASNSCTDACGWEHFNLKNLVQWWIDNDDPTVPQDLGSNHGFAMTSPTDPKMSYRSKEADETAQVPYLETIANSFPSAPTPISPKGNLETNTPTLRIAPSSDSQNKVKDVNNDNILVKYQVSKRTDFTTASNIVWESGWLDYNQNPSTMVPAGVLLDGKSYFWRAISGDQCTGAFSAYQDTSPSSSALLCDDFNNARSRNASDPQPFSVNLKVRGSDNRWALWRQGLGNGMTLRVNEANGNLSLGYPVDSLGVDGKELDVGLSYNVQTTENRGLTPGWDVFAGPAARPEQIPVRLEPLKVDPADTQYYGVAIVYQSGRRDVFVSDGSGEYFVQSGPTAGIVRRDGFGDAQPAGGGSCTCPDKEWTYSSFSGGTYRFDTDGNLKAAKPSTSTPSERGFNYKFQGLGPNGTSVITQVKDPVGQAITFTWIGERLRTIQDARGTWTLGYNTDLSRLTSVTDPTQQKVTFDYNGYGLSGIRDGRQFEDNLSATTIGYFEGSGLTGAAGSACIPAPPSSPPPIACTVTLAGSDKPWTFSYLGGFNGGGYTARTEVTDPRGQVTSDADDFKQIVYFNTIGLPIQVDGPRLTAGDGSYMWPQTFQKWDSNGNLICRRDPAANAIYNPGTCVGADGRQTEYTYQSKAPYLLERTVGPNPDPDPTHTGSVVDPDARLVTTNAFDEGFVGLRAEFFDGNNLANLEPTNDPDKKDIKALPKSEAILNPSIDWQGGGPTQLGGQSNDFSVRFFGKIHADQSPSAADDYGFRLTTEDNGRLIIGQQVVYNCWGTERTGPIQNCGNADKIVHLSPGWHNIIVEYQAKAGNASLSLKWRKPSDNPTWDPVPNDHLQPYLNDLTSSKVGISSQPSKFSKMGYTYIGDDLKLRALPDSTFLQGNNVLSEGATNSRIAWNAADGPNGRVGGNPDVAVADERRFYRAGPTATNTEIFATTTTPIIAGIPYTESFEFRDDGDLVPEITFFTSAGHHTPGTTIEPIGQGWKRASATYTPGAGETNVRAIDFLLHGSTWTYVDVRRDRLEEGSNTTTLPMGYTYDTRGRVLTDQDGTDASIVHEYRHDPATGGVCEWRTTDREGLVTTRACNAAGDVTDESVQVTVPVGQQGQAQTRTTHWNLDALGRTTSVDYADGGREEYLYHDDGQVKQHSVKVTASDTRVTDYAYWPQGWLKTVTLPDPDYGMPLPRPTTSYTYDRAGNRETMTDELDKVWNYAYNSLDELTSKTSPTPVQDVWTRTYDKGGNLSTSTTPAGVVTKRNYDAAGRLVSTQLGSLALTKYKYNARGDQTSVTTPDQIETTNGYDAVGNVISETAPVGTSGASKTKTWGYDDAGFLVTTTDFRGNRTTYANDKMGRLKVVTSPTVKDAQGNNVTNVATYTYNNAGELLEAKMTPGTNGAASIVNYTRDLRGRVKKVIDGMGFGTDNTYDLAGQLTRVADPRAITISYTYDGLGNRLSRKATDDLSVGCPLTCAVLSEETYTYDAGSNLKKALVTGRSDLNVQVDYDNASRPTVISAGNDSTTYTYDHNRIATRADAAGTTAYQYATGTGRLSKIVNPLAAGDTVYSYKDSGLISSRTDSNGLVHTYGYDAADRLKSEVVMSGGTQVASFVSGYDADSNVTSRTSQVQGSSDNGDWTYTYDALSRLIASTGPGQTSSTYAYDGAGNRTKATSTKIVSGQPVTTTTTTSFNLAGRPTSSSDGTTTTTYNHDNAGNLTKVQKTGTGWVYDYDPWGRQTKATQTVGTGNNSIPNPIALTITYDALNRTILREKRLVTALVTSPPITSDRSFYAGTSEELTKTTSSVLGQEANLAISISYANDAAGAPLVIKKSVTTTPIDPITGALGPPTEDLRTRFAGVGPHGDLNYQSDGSGAVVGSYSYDPWGVPRSTNGETALLGFQSDPTDPETGLVDMGARNYAPELGRFTTQDPVAGDSTNPLSMNPYIYGSDNSVTMVDPTGMYNAPDAPCTCHGNATPHRGSSSGGGGSTRTAVASQQPAESGHAPLIGDDVNAYNNCLDIECLVNQYTWMTEMGYRPYRPNPLQTPGVTAQMAVAFVALFAAPELAVGGASAARSLAGKAISRLAPLITSIGGGVSSLTASARDRAVAALNRITNAFAAETGSIGGASNEFTAGDLASYERQLAERGVKSLIDSGYSLQANIDEHLQRIASALEDGGYTSSMVREVVSFQRQLNAIVHILSER